MSRYIIKQILFQFFADLEFHVYSAVITIASRSFGLLLNGNITHWEGKNRYSLVHLSTNV